MRVLFLSANTESINMPVIPLGLCGVASYTERAGHDVRLLDFMNINEVKPVINKEIDDFKPDIIGISIRNIDDQRLKVHIPLLLLLLSVLYSFSS